MRRDRLQAAWSRPSASRTSRKMRIRTTSDRGRPIRLQRTTFDLPLRDSPRGITRTLLRRVILGSTHLATRIILVKHKASACRLRLRPKDRMTSIGARVRKATTLLRAIPCPLDPLIKDPLALLGHFRLGQDTRCLLVRETTMLLSRTHLDQADRMRSDDPMCPGLKVVLRRPNSLSRSRRRRHLRASLNTLRRPPDRHRGPLPGLLGHTAHTRHTPVPPIRMARPISV